MFRCYEVALVHCNIIKNNYQQNSKFFYRFVPNKLLGKLLDISPKNFMFLKSFNAKFSYIENWLTDQDSKSLEIEYSQNLLDHATDVL